MNSSAVSAGRRTIRVLLVEDDPDQRVITQFWPAQVHGTAYAVEWARTYDEDLEHLRDSEFDVCLLDQRLGKHTGTDFLRAAVAGGYDAPMVVLTTADEPVVDEAAVRLGAAEYLVKTQVTPTLLDRSIRHAMARARQATGRSPTSTDSAGCAIPVDAAPREQNDALAHQDTLAALRESEAQFRLMAETTGAVLYRLRYDTLRYEYMSPAVERITGYTADEINELGFKSLVEQIEMPPGGPSREDLLSLRLKAEGHEHAAYYRVRTRSGEHRWLQDQTTPWHDREGCLLGSVGVLLDVTDRRLAEEALAEAGERSLREYGLLLERLDVLANAVGAAPDLMAVFLALLTFVQSSAPCSGLYVSLLEPDRARRKCVYAWSEGVEEDASALPPLPLNHSPNSRAILTGEIVVTDDYEAATAGLPTVEQGANVNPDPAKSSICVPLAVQGRVVGAFEVQSTRQDAYAPEHVTALKAAAGIAAIAVESAALLERERRAAETAQRASQEALSAGERFRLLFEHSPDGIVLLDPSDPDVPSRIVDCNVAFARMNGYERDELIGRSIRVLQDVKPEPGGHRRQLDYLRRIGRAVLPGRHVRKNGSIFPIETSTSVVSLGGRELILGVDRDTTEREQAAEALAASEAAANNARAWFESLVDSVDGIVWESTEGPQGWASTYVSRRAEAILGYSPADWLADSEFWESRVHPEDRELSISRSAAGARGTEPFEVEYRMIAADGKVVWFRDVITPLVDSKGQRRVRGVMLDVTERVLAEREAGRAADQRRRLHELSHALTASLETDEVADRTLHALADLVPHDAGSLMLPDRRTGGLFHAYAAGGRLAQELRGRQMPAGRGITAAVFASGRAELVNDSHLDPRATPPLGLTVERLHTMAVPVVAGAERLGVFALARQEGEPFSHEEFELARAFVANAGVALRNAVLYDRAREAEALERDHNAVLQGIARGGPLQQTLEQLTEILERQLAGSLASVMLADGPVLRPAAGKRLPCAYVAAIEDGVAIGPAAGSCGTAAHRRGPVVVEDIASDPLWTPWSDLAASHGLRACWSTPFLGSAGEVLGTFAVYWPQKRAATAAQLELLDGVGQLAAVAVERSRHASQLSISRDETLRALGLALEYRDYETKGHTDRVVDLAVRLGESLGLAGADLEALRWGAYLHDTGKIAVPDSVLLKPGRPTAAEWDLIKRHPDVGFNMLKHIPSLPAETLAVVLHHHERWDGTGYPAGLAGEKIPLHARVFAAVDVYDALTSERPYKRAWSRADALAEIERSSGSHFDPRVAAALVELAGGEPEPERVTAPSPPVQLTGPEPEPAEEARRLEALRRYGILDTAPEEAFDRLARTAARILRAPIALVSFVDEARQWFKARTGVEDCEMSLDTSICAFAIRQDAVFVVPDASKDPRFKDFRTVTGPPGVRFYAGAPLRTPDGLHLGTLCVADTSPRPGLGEDEAELLADPAATAMDELELRRALAEVERLATFDALTGVRNRRAFDRDLRRALESAGEAREPLSVLMLDLDGLKAINDTEGHHRGDELLRAFAVELAGQLRREDTVYRLGGDEFAAILPGTGSPGFAGVAERVRLAEATIRAAGFPAAGVSLGLAAYPRDGADAASLQRESDRRMYAEKGKRQPAPERRL